MSQKILLIEDDPFISEIYLTSLKKEGYELSLATDGKSGLEMAKEIKPDLILLDLLLPKMNGFEVLKEIRKEKFLKNTPVIILTNYGTEDVNEEAKKLEVLDVFLKVELTPQELIAKIKEYLS